jgi:hypothetical protein
MERFEQAMIKQGLRTVIIEQVKESSVWRERIRNYTSEELDVIIQVFPKLYSGNVHSLFYSSPADFIRARKQYVPMDIDI